MNKLLIIEDNPGDVVLIKELLKESPSPYQIDETSKLSEGLNKIVGGQYSVVLLDLSLPDSTGLESIKTIVETAPLLAIIVLTGMSDDLKSLEALNCGAQDYLVKGEVDAKTLIRSIRYSIERKKIESERKRIEKMKDEFISTVSHEIRTPLAIIKGAVSNLKDGIAGQLTEQQNRIIAITDKNINRLNRLINDLLDLSRLESGHASVNRQKMDALPFVREALQNFKKHNANSQIGLHLEADKLVPPLYADQDLITRLIDNILDNAYRYAKNQIKVAISSVEHQGEGKIIPMIRISISDDGAGIEAKNIPLLFNKFQQINRPMGGAGYKGTGLGLVICKEIVELHRGKISVVSEFGNGTTFQIDLPPYDVEEDFRTIFREELNKAHDAKATLGLILLSIENLKDVKKGVSETSQLLSDIETQLRAHGLRKTDQFFRYSLKDFMIMNHNVNRSQAESIAKRLGGVIKQTLIDTGDIKVIPVISVGLALFPDDSPHEEQLVELVKIPTITLD